MDRVKDKKKVRFGGCTVYYICGDEDRAGSWVRDRMWFNRRVIQLEAQLLAIRIKQSL